MPATDREPQGFKGRTRRRGLKTEDGDRSRDRQGKCTVGRKMHFSCFIGYLRPAPHENMACDECENMACDERASKGTAAVSAWCQGHSKPQQRGTPQHGQCEGSVCVREEGVGAADRDSAGGQVVKRTSVSLDFHRKK